MHGGANEAAMAMIEQWHSADEAEAGIMRMLANKEKIMGFGHAIYRESDPRNALIKEWSKALSEAVGDTHLYAVSERVEAVMKREKDLFCNADFFHASAYHFMGIPTKLFTPIFVMSRLTGWAAHVYEQRSNNRIIRPSADYVGPEHQTWFAAAHRNN
ncbi:methylcitrate synthase [Vibrio cholerae]|nr:methylcitrate synthase [Vibrio cholerae]